MTYHDRRILSLCLPPHTTHLLQPLDVSIFGPLQKAYGDIVNRKCEGGVDSINKDLFIDIYTEAREKSFRLSVIQARFKVTDLVSLNPEEVYKRLPQGQEEDSSDTQEPELPEPLAPKTPKTSRQLRDQIQLLKTTHQSPTTELRLRKLEKGFATLEADNILLN